MPAPDDYIEEPMTWARFKELRGGDALCCCWFLLGVLMLGCCLSGWFRMAMH